MIFSRFPSTATGRRTAPARVAARWLGAASVLRLRACTVPTFVRTRFRAAQVEWHLAIVHSLLVARLAAEPLLSGAHWLGMARFALGTRCRTWRCHRRQQEKYPRHDANRTQRHPKRIGHRRVFSG